MKKICSAILAASLFSGGMAIAGPRSGAGPVMNAQCRAGFTANPTTYTEAQLRGVQGVTYTCSEPWSGGWFPNGNMKCSPSFRPHNPVLGNHRVTYTCISIRRVR